MASDRILYSIILIPLLTSFCACQLESSEDTVPLTIEGKTFYIHTDLPEIDRLNTTKLIRNTGYDSEEIDVTTEDGYILKMFHIVNDNITQDLPIIMLHGFLDSSDTYCLRHNSSPAIHLAQSGYDVWIGNFRGNRFSRHHATLDPDVDKEFWDFSFEENGSYDYPAMIDEVLERTGKSQLIVIGHSQGTLNFFVMGANRPEYNNKVKVFIALGPVFFVQHLRGIASNARVLLPEVYTTYTARGEVEILNVNCTLRRILQNLCTEYGDVSYKICLNDFFFPLLGPDPDQLEPEFIPLLVAQYFAGTSVKLFAHAGQLVDRHFGKFNYGLVGNLIKYKSPVAPLYNLTNVSTKVVLMVGKNDYLATVPDTRMLRDALPNVDYFEMPLEKFSHIDFIWGSKMSEHFFPYLHKFLDKYK